MTRVISKPSPSSVVIDADGRPSIELQIFHDDLEQGLNNNLLGAAVRLPSYTVTTLPLNDIEAGDMIFVTNDVGGPTPAWYNGSSWLRFRDNVVVS